MPEVPPEILAILSSPMAKSFVMQIPPSNWSVCVRVISPPPPRGSEFAKHPYLFKFFLGKQSLPIQSNWLA